MVYMIEYQISYILDGLRTMERHIEVRPEIQEAFNTELQQRMQGAI